MTTPRFSAGLALVANPARPRVLLLRRSSGVKSHPGMWNLPGGGVDPGETAREAAAREAWEEAGYDHRKRRALVRWLHDVPTYTTVVATLKDGQTFTPTLNWESDRSGWYTRQQALQLDLHPMLRLFLEGVTDAFMPRKGRGRSRYEDEGFVGDFWGARGAGVLFQADESKRILLLKRSWEVEQPDTWGIPGGAVPVDRTTGEGKNLWKAAQTEAREETGWAGGASPRGYRVWRDPAGSGFTFTTFLVRVLLEFEPELNWESEDYVWVSPDVARSWDDLHFGVEWLLNHREAWKKLPEKQGRAATKVRGRGARPAAPPPPPDKERWWKSVDHVKRAPQVATLAWQEATMVQQLLPVADDFYRRTALSLGNPYQDQAFFQPGRISLGSNVGSADLLAHEIGHLFDSSSRVSAGECMMGTDAYACREAGPIKDVTLKARALFKETAAGAMEPRIRKHLDAMLPRPFSKRVARGEDVRIEEVLAQLVPKDAAEAAFSHIAPFGGFRTKWFAEETGTSMPKAKRVAAAMRLLPMGVSVHCRTAEERIAYTRTIRRRTAEDQIVGYFMASHEVFARLFDQAVRTRAASLGQLAGSLEHDLDLPPDVFAQIEPEFWGMAEDLGWTR